MKLPASTNELNRYGFRVLTEGLDIRAYQKNPVMLLDHNMGVDNLLGAFINLTVEGGVLYVEPEWDEEDKRALRLKKKHEKGLLKALSIGFRPLAFSDDPADMLPGQQRMTITKAELLEISWVTVPANAGAVQLYLMDEDTQTLSAQAIEKVVPLISQNPNSMKKEHLSLIGLAADATDEAIEAKLKELNKQSDPTEGAEDLKAVRLSIETLTAKVTALETQMGTEATKLSSIVEGLKGKQPVSVPDDRKNWGYLEWAKNDPEGLNAIRVESPTQFEALVAKTYSS